MILRSTTLLLAALSCSPLLAARWAEEMFVTKSHDFGTVARGAKAEFAFEFTNKYVGDVRAAGARVSCSCISTQIQKPELKTYDTGAIVAKLNTTAYRGQRQVTITVTFDKPQRATVQLQIKGFIRDDVQLEPSAVDFGEIDRGAAVEKMIRVSRSGRNDWRVLEVKGSNPHLSGEVVRVKRHGSGITCDVRVRLEAGAPVGYIGDHLTLLTNDDRHREIPVQVEGRVCPELIVSPSSLFLGAFSPGQSVTRPLVVRSKTPFRVLSVGSEHGAVEAASGSDTAKPIHVIPVTFTARDRPGKVVEVIRVETDLDGNATEVTAHAVVRP